MTENNKMREMPVYKLMIQMGIPMILSMALQAVYNIVDSAFVGNMKEGSEAALNALTLVFPVQMLMLQLQLEPEWERMRFLQERLDREILKGGNGCRKQFVSGCDYLCDLFLFGIVGVNAYISSQTANPEVLSMGTSYLKICCVLSFGIVFFSLFENYCRRRGAHCILRLVRWQVR